MQETGAHDLLHAGKINMKTALQGDINKIAAALGTSLKSIKRWQVVLQTTPNNIFINLRHQDPEKRISKFYEGMSSLAAAGLMKGYTPARIAQMRQDNNKLMPEGYDYTANVNVLKCADKKIARQMLENQALMPQIGFNAPAPGAPSNMSFLDIIKSDKLSGVISKAQIKQLEEASKQAAKQFSKNKSELGLNYKIGKYKGFDAAFLKSAKASNMCQAITIENYLLSGSLWALPDMLPPGSKPCFTLGKQPGMGEKPDSTIAQQGYAYKEEAEDLVEKIIAVIKKSINIKNNKKI